MYKWRWHLKPFQASAYCENSRERHKKKLANNSHYLPNGRRGSDCWVINMTLLWANIHSGRSTGMRPISERVTEAFLSKLRVFPSRFFEEILKMKSVRLPRHARSWSDESKLDPIGRFAVLILVLHVGADVPGTSSIRTQNIISICWRFICSRIQIKQRLQLAICSYVCLMLCVHTSRRILLWLVPCTMLFILSMNFVPETTPDH